MGCVGAMSQFGALRKGRSGARCDGCGKFTKAIDGSYVRPNGQVGYITAYADESPDKDFCDECRERGHAK